MGKRVNAAAHELAHRLAQREIARQKPNFAETKKYWNERVRQARHDLAVAWSEEHLPGGPMEQGPLPGIFD